MKHLVWMALLLAAAPESSVRAGTLGRPRNVLVLLTDDQQPDAIAALGNPDLVTPAMDRLVAEGTSFTNAYCMGSDRAAVCAPSRAMLLSGRSLWRLGPDPFDLDLPLLPEWLRARGFETFATGKWHNGRRSFARAFETGDEIFFGGMGSHSELSVYDFDPSGAYPPAARHPIAAFSSTAFADAVIDWLEQRDPSRPFFAWVAFTSPHDPRTPPPEVRALYDPAALTLPEPLLPEHPFDNGELHVRDEELAPWPRTPEIVRQHLADYYGMITQLDRDVGRILDALDRSGQAEDTLVVLASDQGLALGRHGLFGKQNLYEHSARAPLVLRGPRVPAGARSESPVYLFDLVPTLCDLLGTDPFPCGDGRSLLPLLRGQPGGRDALLLGYKDVQRAVRSGDWKLIEYPRAGITQLFDLAHDPHETRDLASDPGQSERVARLRATLRGLQRAAGDPLAPPAPNVVLFVVDDLGWQDLSVPLAAEPTPFNQRYRTPAAERLAREGLAFTDAYSAAPVCTPTRVAILTGRHPARTHVTNWTLQGDPSAAHPTLLPPEWNVNGFSPDPGTPRAFSSATLPELLAAAGYRTIHVGKAHWGALDTPGADPLALGFQRNVAGHAAGGPGSHWGERDYSAAWRGGGRVWDVPDLEAYHGTHTYLTEALTREALKQIDQAVADEKPFFLHLAHYAVHAPLEADARFVERYRALGLDEREAAYASMVEGYDRSLNDVLAKLDELGIADTTLVVFASDNGGLSAHGRGGQPHTHNAPLRSGKGSAYEGGVRVPLLVRWPGVVPPGQRCSTPVTSADLYPTLLAAAGLALGSSDGVDLGPLLRDPDRRIERDLFWHYPHQWGAAGPGIHPYSAIRRGPLKLIWFWADARAELYDLANDLGETHDLAAERPDSARELTDALSAWLEASGAQPPISKATGLPLALPGR